MFAGMPSGGIGKQESMQSLQVTDGAAAVLMMTRREALHRQLPILGIFRSFAAVGVDPAIMGVGPAVAIPEAVKQAGLAIDDIDLFELNEAFASQVYQRHLSACLHSAASPLLSCAAHTQLRCLYTAAP